MVSAVGRPSSNTFGRYRLLEQLGAGGMASVHRAVAEGSRGFTRDIVVKRILPGQAREPRFVAMMIAEARICSLLHHPSIVQVFDFGEVDGEVFMAMEYIEGFDLHAIIRDCKRSRQPLEPKLVAYVVSEVANALAYAHALRDDGGRPLHIIHRDVSPSNIMLTEHGTIKLLDFGVAKAATLGESEQGTRTSSGTIKGKIGYMSPEQADVGMLDHRSDIFALGIVFWECLTLRRLFKSDSDLHTLRLIRIADIQAPSTVVPGISPELDAVVMKMLARDPAQRYATGDEVARALAPFIHREGADARTVRDFVVGFSSVQLPPPSDAGRPRALEDDSGSDGALRSPTKPIPPPRRKRRPWGVALAALCVIGLSALVLQWRRTRPPETAAPIVAAVQMPTHLEPKIESPPIVPTPVAETSTPAVSTPAPGPLPKAGTNTRRPDKARTTRRAPAPVLDPSNVKLKNPF